MYRKANDKQDDDNKAGRGYNMFESSKTFTSLANDPQIGLWLLCQKVSAQSK